MRVTLVDVRTEAGWFSVSLLPDEGQVRVEWPGSPKVTYLSEGEAREVAAALTEVTR